MWYSYNRATLALRLECLRLRSLNLGDTSPIGSLIDQRYRQSSGLAASHRNATTSRIVHHMMDIRGFKTSEPIFSMKRHISQSMTKSKLRGRFCDLVVPYDSVKHNRGLDNTNWITQNSETITIWWQGDIESRYRDPCIPLYAQSMAGSCT